MTGMVTLVGAGPGSRALLTLAGAEAIRRADAVVYDRLVDTDILTLIPCGAERIDVGKRAGVHPVPQEEINAILVRLAQAGKNTVRLKGGDCYLFGRGGEECEYLHAHGVPFRVIPGVTSALAAPAFAGIPVTHREYGSSVHIITAQARADKEPEIDYPSLVRLGGTLVFLMGLAALEQVMDGLLAVGMNPQMPAAVIENGTRGIQRKVVDTVSGLAAQVRTEGLQSPALIVVGRVCACSNTLDWWTGLPLHGKRIAVTRPQERAGGLTARLRALGAEVIEAPCIAIEPAAELEPLRAALENRYDWAAFTSPAGVKAAADALRRLGRDLRALYGMQLAAIGRGTAEALAAYGLTADLIPAQYDGAHLAAALLERLPEKGAVLLLRARQGGKILPEALRRAGMTVADVPVYDTVYRCGRTDELRRLLAEGALDYVTFTSGSTVEGFVRAVGDTDLSDMTALCIGAQTEEIAKRYQMKTITASNAAIDDMIACLLEDCHHV
ncbi:MAG: uroporphyrinogen-III C-methyltransferase [Agathobaculum desmolans]|uniref:uroporphyrinogen-III C-methyltransferase n=1 Tax=Agathobaculum desmolans TaxID=39484 RepID=UPI00399255C6